MEPNRSEDGVGVTVLVITIGEAPDGVTVTMTTELLVLLIDVRELLLLPVLGSLGDRVVFEATTVLVAEGSVVLGGDEDVSEMRLVTLPEPLDNEVVLEPVGKGARFDVEWRDVNPPDIVWKGV